MLSSMTANILFYLVAFGGGIYLLLNLYALLDSNRLIFQPQDPGYTHLPDEFQLVSGQGEKITAVFWEHPQAKQTLLFSHGNAEDMSSRIEFQRQFFDLGYSVLMYDYRGYGTSEGKPSVGHAKQDIEAAYRWLVEEKGIEPHRIIAQGRSLGGGPSVWLAAHHKVGGLVLESTFVSTFRVKTVWPLLPWDKFNSLRLIKKVDCPVLVIHGRDDTTVPFWHGQKLYDAAPRGKMHLWIDGARHNDYAYVAGEAYFDAFKTFSRQVEKATA